MNDVGIRALRVNGSENFAEAIAGQFRFGMLMRGWTHA